MYVASSDSNAWFYHSLKKCSLLLLALSGHIVHVTPAEMKGPDRVH